MDHAARKFDIQKEYADIDTHHEMVPPVFVVQLQIPSDAPAWFNSETDGPGWAVLFFFRITDNTVKELKALKDGRDDEVSPQVRLWAKWCSECENDKAWRSRFKFIAACSNMLELGVPGSIADWNAKPILIRRTGSIHRGEGGKYMEFDMHIHEFDTVARKGIHFMTAQAGGMLTQIGYVIEGREDDELPEALFGCAALTMPQEDMCEFLFD
jgi:hypothetical protein